MSINGEREGGPIKLPVALMDILAGHHLKEALLLAYIHKLKTGEGQQVSVSLIDAAISSLANQGTNWLVGQQVPGRSGSLHPNIAPYGEVFTTSDDKKVLLAVGTDRQFQLLCDKLCITLGDNFISNQLRVKNRKELYDQMAKVMQLMQSNEILQILHDNNIPGGVINSIPEALSQYTGMLLSGNALKGIKSFAAKMGSLEKHSHFLPPPHFNEHAECILKEILGLNMAKINELKGLNVIP